jgi:hypothetical protein
VGIRRNTMKDFIIKLLVPFGFFTDKTRDPYLMVLHAHRYLRSQYEGTGLFHKYMSFFPEQNEALTILSQAAYEIIKDYKSMIIM